MKTYRHFQLSEDEITVIGISELSNIEKDRKDLIYFPETPDNSHITFGWRFINREWFEPSLQTQEELYEQELSDINFELKNIYENEKYKEWLGETLIEPMNLSLEQTRKEQLIIRRNELMEILKQY